MALVSRRTVQLSLKKESFSASLEKDSFFSVLEKCTKQLGDRPKSILWSRFGLDGKTPQTLEQIGKTYGITRERVRQIIRSVVKDVRNQNDNHVITTLCQKITSTIDSHSGILVQEALYGTLAGEDGREAGAVRFFVENFAEVEFLKEDSSREASLITKAFRKKSWKEVVGLAEEIFKKRNHPLLEDELLALFRKDLSGVASKTVIDYLQTSKKVKRNVFGLWGLATWGEICPKGTKERVYLVLTSVKKPLHFREIARLIDHHELQKKGRKTHHQTVHNELIKDKRFVLVGRGMYALEEWGYKQGTIRDVISHILREAGEPLSRKEVFERLSALREAKHSTVIINLNLYFLKVGKDRYTLKEA